MKKEVEKNQKEKSVFGLSKPFEKIKLKGNEKRESLEKIKSKAKSLVYSLLDSFEKMHVFSRWGKSDYIQGVMYFFASFLLSFASLGEARPFGIAFALASSKSGGTSKKASAFLGLAFSALFMEKGYFYLLSYVTSFASLIALSFAGSREKYIPDNLSFHTLSIASGALGALLLLAYGLSAFAIQITGVVVITLAFCGLFHGGKQTVPLFFECGFLALSAGCVLALSGLSLGYFSFGLITAVIFCIEGAKRGGYYLGSLSGFVTGLALGGEYIIILPIGSFICGVVKDRKRLFMTTAFVTSLFALFLWRFSSEELINATFNTLWGSALWCSASCFFMDKSRHSLPLLVQRMKNAEEKRFSDALYAISLSLSGLSKSKKREREEKARLVIEGIFSKECETCHGCRLNLDAQKSRICQCVMKNKKISDAEFSSSFLSECPRCGIIKDKINELIEKKQYKTSLRIDSLAEDYMTISKILSHGQTRAEGRYCKNLSASKEIKLGLELKKIHVQRVDVIGARLPEVEISGIPFKIPFQENAFKKEVERVLQRDVEQIYLQTQGDRAKIGFKAVCPLKIHCFKTSVPKLGEIICGDSVAVFEGEDGYFYALINDGMGSGRDAAVCSKLGSVFLEKLISSGIDKCGAVSMLGNVISSSEDEIFTTVDLTEIDMVRGKISFLKAGAAPSWILRNGKAYSISSKTLPCGIIPKTVAEQTIVDCFSGDVIIMASDGGEWAGEALESIERVLKRKSSDPKAVALFLADEAARKSGRSDDISFCVMSIL